MSKLKKTALINSYFEQIVDSIIKQREEINRLAIVKNEALLCSKNYQNDINLLKQCITVMKQKINPNIELHNTIPLAQNQPLVNHFKKKVYFAISKMDKLQMNDIICSVKYSDNGYFFAFATFKTVYLYDANTKLCINSAAIPYDPNSIMEKITRTIAISPNSSIIALCAADFSIILYKVPTLKLIGKIETKSNVVSCLCFFNDNSHLITSAESGKLTVWSVTDLSKTREVSLSKNKNVVGISVTIDDLTVVVVCSDGCVYIMDSNFCEEPRIYDSSSNFIFGSSLSRSGSYLALSLKNNEVKLFSLIGGFQFQKAFIGHGDFVVCVEFGHNGKLLFTGSKDESIKIWNIESAENLWTIPLNENTVFCISHHPKRNEFVACTGDGTIIIFSYLFQQ